MPSRHSERSLRSEESLFFLWFCRRGIPRGVYPGPAGARNDVATRFFSNRAKDSTGTQLLATRAEPGRL